MQLLDAQNLLPKFRLALIGHTFKRFNLEVKDVFIGMTDIEMCQIIYEALRNNVGVPQHPSDEGRHTIVAVLKNGKIISAKSIVVEDKVAGLIEDVESLDYVQGVQHGFDPITGASSQT